MYTGQRLGAARLSAQVADMIAFNPFAIAYPAGGGSAGMSLSGIVGDELANGIFSTIDTDTGISYTMDYAVSSTLTVNGTVGEVVPVSLGSLAEPVIEPILHYSLFTLGGATQNTVFDRYDIIHGKATDLTATRDSAEGFRGSLQFTTDASAIRVPNHTALDKASERGVQTQAEGGFSIALNFFVPSAYAAAKDASSPGFWASIKAGVTKVGMGIVTGAKAYAEFNRQVLAGIFLGDTSTTVGATADFIAGFIPFFGDARDLALQGWYVYTDDARYDQLIVIVASLGLAADSASLVGIAAAIPSGGTTLTLTIVGQILKNMLRVVKTTAKLIPKGPFRSVLLHKLKAMLVNIKSGQWNALGNTLSVGSLLYAVLVDPKLREVMFGAIQKVSDFDVWARFVSKYEDLPAKVASLDEKLLDFFITSANARVIDDLVIALKNRITDLELRGKTGTEIGQFFTLALTKAEKYAKNVDINDVLAPSFFRTTFRAYEKIGDKGLDVIMNAWSATRKGTLDFKEFMSVFSDLITNAPHIFNDPAFSKGISHVLSDMGSSTKSVTYKVQGARHHIHIMQDASSARLGAIIRGIEVPKVIFVDGKAIGKRIHDDIIEIAGNTIYRDAKSWDPKYAVSNVKSSLNKLPVDVVDINGVVKKTKEPAGQMFLDMAIMWEKRLNKNEWIEWTFDKRMTDVDLGNIVTMLKKEMSPNGGAAKKLFKELKLDNALDNDEWFIFLESLSNKIPEMIKRVGG